MQHILIVEHDPDLRDLLATIFEDGGYAVDMVVDYAQALESVRHAAPDAILVHLGISSGRYSAFVATCHQALATARLPIAVLADPGQAACVEDLPVDAFITTPFDLDVLLAVVARLAAGGALVAAAGS
jgi:CheY-like chemotaxis protein